MLPLKFLKFSKSLYDNIGPFLEATYIELTTENLIFSPVNRKSN